MDGQCVSQCTCRHCNAFKVFDELIFDCLIESHQYFCQKFYAVWYCADITVIMFMFTVIFVFALKMVYSLTGMGQSTCENT